jgi:hypothetical protein
VTLHVTSSRPRARSMVQPMAKPAHVTIYHNPH